MKKNIFRNNILCKFEPCSNVNNTNSANNPKKSDTTKLMTRSKMFSAPTNEFNALNKDIVKIKTITDNPKGLNNNKSEIQPIKKTVHGETEGTTRKSDKTKIT